MPFVEYDINHTCYKSCLLISHSLLAQTDDFLQEMQRLQVEVNLNLHKYCIIPRQFAGLTKPSLSHRCIFASLTSSLTNPNIRRSMKVCVKLQEFGEFGEFEKVMNVAQRSKSSSSQIFKTHLVGAKRIFFSSAKIDYKLDLRWIERHTGHQTWRRGFLRRMSKRLSIQIIIPICRVIPTKFSSLLV